MKTKLIFYSEHARQLEGSVGAKIDRLVNGHIRYNKKTKCFEILPIEGYNSTTHLVKNHKAFGFSCSCQAWQGRLKKHEGKPTEEPAPSCSHVAAVYEHLARMNQERRQLKIIDAMENMF